MLDYNPIVSLNINVSETLSDPHVYDTGLILGTSEVITAEERVRAYTSVEDMISDGFTDTSEEVVAAGYYFNAAPTPVSLLVGKVQTGEQPAVALQAILAIRSDFYGIFVCRLSDVHLSALATELNRRNRFCLFYGIAGTPEEAVASKGCFQQMYKQKARRVLGTYVTDPMQAAGLMGLAMGLTRMHADDAFSLCYKTAPGVTPTPVTQAQVDAIKALNANVYITRGTSHNMFEAGSTASGTRYDELLYMDQLTTDLQDACLDAIAGRSGRLPQNDTATAVLFNVLSAVLDRYTARGILGTALWRGETIGRIETGDIILNGYALFADSYDVQSAADRAAHRAMPIHVVLCFTGSIESVVLNINIQP